MVMPRRGEVETRAKTGIRILWKCLPDTNAREQLIEMPYVLALPPCRDRDIRVNPDIGNSRKSTQCHTIHQCGI